MTPLPSTKIFTDFPSAFPYYLREFMQNVMFGLKQIYVTMSRIARGRTVPTLFIYDVVQVGIFSLN